MENTRINDAMYRHRRGYSVYNYWNSFRFREKKLFLCYKNIAFYVIETMLFNFTILYTCCWISLDIFPRKIETASNAL